MLVWLLISCGVFLVCGVLVALVSIGENRGWFWCDTSGLGVVGLIFGIMALISLICCVSLYPSYATSYNILLYEIVSIRNEDSIEGSFFLGSGTLNDKTYYVCYSKTNKGYKLEKLETDKSYVIEDNDKTPSVYKVNDKNSLGNYYNIYVPVGTIITTFVLN